MTQRINEQIGAFPAIESERHLVQVGGKMFGADLVPRSHDAAFESEKADSTVLVVNVAVP